MPLPTPVGKQAEVVFLAHSGHFVVLGTAGSGKTTMAIHRAAFLANPSTSHGGRTLLVTYNKTLVTYFNYLRPRELRDVDVRTYHGFALGYLRSRGHATDGLVCQRGQREDVIGRAIRQVREAHPPDPLLDRPSGFFSEEISWISRHGIETLEAYVAADRIGRAQARLERGKRPLMFAVYRAYLEIRRAEGKLFDWDDVAMAARRELAADPDERHYRHVVIDEGQDFSPEMLRSLALAVPADGSVTVFADVAQQIYGRRLSWKDAGLSVGTAWTFDRNYRNSPQVAALARAISEMPYFADEPDVVVPTGFAAEGPPPTVVSFASWADETAFVIEAANEAATTGTVAVLVRRKRDAASIATLLPNAITLDRELGVWSTEAKVYCGTLHSAKGLEFDTVILPRLSSHALPEPELVSHAGEDEARADDGRLLYVAVTRARQNLIITHTDAMTDLMPVNDGLWQELRR